MENFVLVIGRQYGAGGRSLGKKLAETFGVPYYDKELLSEAAESMGFNSEIFTQKDEKRPSFLRSILSFNYGSLNDSIQSETLSSENIYKFQSDVIRSIAEKGSCVIVGRTADYILRDHKNLLSIFINAPIEHRAKLIHERGDAESIEKAIEKAKKSDKSRESYYNYFTNQHWGRADNYHLTFDSSKISTEAIINLIQQHLSAK